MISDYRYPGSGIMRAVHGASERASATKEYIMTITLDTRNANVNTASGAKLTGVKSAQEKQTEENTAAQTVQTRKFDTVELSENAQQYLSADTSETDGQTAEAQIVSDSQSSSSSSEEISSSELYSYTDDQLSELLSKGEITQLQYNTEMAKRGEE